MKNSISFLWGRGRKPRRVTYTQLEFALPGSRLSRDEIGFLDEIRRLKAQLRNGSSHDG
jgi:hypothetical protein